MVTGVIVETAAKGAALEHRWPFIDITYISMSQRLFFSSTSTLSL